MGGLFENGIGMSQIRIAGAGPAGSAAAIAASMEGAAAEILERSREGRHKVCGEFIPAEAAPVLEALGVWSAFADLRPAPMRWCTLRLGRRTKRWSLAEAGFGLSRLALDRLLLDGASAAGAKVTRGSSDLEGATIVASGRRGGAVRGRRLFGFKAHFAGPQSDGVELYFSRSGYTGVNPVENGETNVCGITTEDELRRFGFSIDEMTAADAALAERMRPLTRQMKWLTTGPLVYSRPRAVKSERVYAAGDALGFVDPFSGSGILNALLTGSLAGRAAARGAAVADYVRECDRFLARPFVVSALLRFAIGNGLSGAAQWIPGDWLYRMTRPGVMGAI